MPSFGGLSAMQIEARLKEGRGQGAGRDYKPFLTVRDVSSSGRSHRVFSVKTQRLHHFLSNLELAVFLTLEWSETVTDIREQFPLNVDDTVRLADEAGIRHPAFKSVYQVMTSDFLVDSASKDRPQFALQIKYAKDLEDRRTVEKLELERRYWHSKNIPWFIVTENNICRAAVKNIEWFNPFDDAVSLDDLHRFYSLYESHRERLPTERVVTIASAIDKTEGLEPGESLYWLRHLLGRRYFLFDITQPYESLLASELIKNTAVPMMEASSVAG